MGLLPLPSFAHRPILAQCRDYLEKNAMIGAFPGKNGFQWVAKEVLGEKFNDVIVFGTDRLPHACRTNVFGEEATLFGIKKVFRLATIPGNKAEETSKVVNQFAQGRFTTVPKNNFLCVQLFPANSCIHPGRM